MNSHRPLKAFDMFPPQQRALHHGAQGITVGGNQDVLAGLEVLLDALVVVGNQAIDDVQQAFGEGNLV